MIDHVEDLNSSTRLIEHVANGRAVKRSHANPKIRRVLTTDLEITEIWRSVTMDGVNARRQEQRLHRDRRPLDGVVQLKYQRSGTRDLWRGEARAGVTYGPDRKSIGIGRSAVGLLGRLQQHCGRDELGQFAIRRCAKVVEPRAGRLDEGERCR